MARLTGADRKLLEEVQSRFPLCTRPYAAIGERLGRGERGVIGSLRSLKKGGVIRRIGPVYDARANGLVTTLVALSVPARRVAAAARVINACDGVTHNYRRRHPLNIWFTLTSPDQKTQTAVLRGIRREISPVRWLELPATGVFTVGLVLPVETGRLDDLPSVRTVKGKTPSAGRRAFPPPARSLTVRIPFDLPLKSKPFPRGAPAELRRLRASGRVRRFGAVLDERRIGYRFTTLATWRVPHARLRKAGRLMASFPQVSHCYARKTGKAWPFNLYTVVHERNRERGLLLLEKLACASGARDYLILESVERLKRSSLRLAPA